MAISQNFPAIQPTLNLNFARSKKLDPRITFTRTSSATRTNGQGLIEIVPTDTPRFDHSYNSVTGAITSLGLLIEESRTNLLTYSEQFNNAAWVKIRAGITTNTSATTAPDGSTNADKLVEDTSATTDHFINVDVAGSTSTTHTASVFIKSAERYRIRLQIIATGAAGNRATAWFDSNTGSVVATLAEGNGSVISTNIQQYPNGWYRCILTGIPSTAGNGTSVNFNITLNTTSTTTVYTGDGTSGIYIWGAQLEVGAFPTSYIPTAASTVTRSGDLAFIDLPSTGWYNYSQGSLIFQHSTVPYATGTSPGYPAIGFAQTSGGSQNSIQYFFDKSTGLSQFLVRDANVDQSTISTTTLTGASAGKVGFAYTTNSFVLVRNGNQVGTDVSGTIPQSIGTLLLGTNSKTVANNFNACISNVIYYPRALSSSQLQNLTK